MEKTCAVCFSPFTTQSGRQLYCLECKAIARKQRQAGYYEAAKEAGTLHAGRSGKCAPRPCAHCGKAFVRGEGCIYCSQACRLAAQGTPVQHYLYLIEAVGQPYCKIGTSVRPMQRLGDLKVPFALRLVAAVPVADTLVDARKIEKIVHSSFKAKAIRQEWFQPITEVAFRYALAHAMGVAVRKPTLKLNSAPPPCASL